MSRYEKVSEGVFRVHRANCPYHIGARCTQGCSYRAEVHDRFAGKPVRKTLRDKEQAKRWRRDKMAQIALGLHHGATVTRLDEAWAEWYGGAQLGHVTNNEGRAYRDAVLRSYESIMRLRVLPKFGTVKLGELRASQVQQFVDELRAKGLAPRTIHNTVVPLRVLYNWAILRERAAINPCIGLELPSGERARDKIVTAPQALTMVHALEDHGYPAWEVAMWATAFFAGLRRGELLALTWPRVNLAEQTIEVTGSWDPGIKGGGGLNGPKTKKGHRLVPIPDVLLPFLEQAGEVVRGRPGLAVVFSRNGDARPKPEHLIARARRAWEEVGLEPMTFHDCRHTYASLMLDAGVDMSEVSKRMGHASINITVDRYGHLVEGSEDRTREKLNTYIAAQVAAVKEKQP